MNSLKYLVIVSILTILFSCTNSKISNEAAFEFEGAWYWTANYEAGTTEEELIDYVNSLANPNQTSFFFLYPPEVNADFFNTESFNYDSYKRTIINDPKPTHGFYKLPTEDEIYDDSLWLFELEYRQKDSLNNLKNG